MQRLPNTLHLKLGPKLNTIMKTKTKVLHILKLNTFKGGAEILVSDISLHAETSHHKILTWGRKLTFSQDDDSVRSECLHFTFSSVCKALKVLIWADVLHIHLFPALYICAFLPKKKVFTEHNTENRRRKFTQLKLIERIIYRCYKKIICISKGTEDSLINWLNCPKDLLCVIHNGVDLKKYKQSTINRKFDPIKKELVIGMAARFVEQKDQRALISAMEFLPKNYFLQLAGEGPKIDEMKMLVTSLGLDSRVTFIGFIKDMTLFYSKIDIYVQSSHWEGFGLPVIEAMATGCPALGSDVPGLNEVIGTESYLFPSGNSEVIAKKIKELSDNSVVYSAAINYSIKNSKRFSIVETTKKYELIYAKFSNSI